MLTKSSPMTNKKRVALIVAGLLLVSGSLYWWTVRPYIASKSCHSMALDNSGYALDNSGYAKENVELWMRNDNAQRDYMFIYEVCLHKEGISP